MPFPKYYAFDAATGLLVRDVGLAALTADGYVGTQLDQKGATNTAMALILNIESIDVANGDEAYTFRVVLSNQSNRSDSVVIATQICGPAAVKLQDTVADAAADRVELFFETQKNGVHFRYVDVYLDVAGTSPSIAFNAYMTKVA